MTSPAVLPAAPAIAPVPGTRSPGRHDGLATTDDVAAYLGVPPATVTAWRYRGRGPRYRTVGRHVRYDWRDVDAWYDAQPGGGDPDAS